MENVNSWLIPSVSIVTLTTLCLGSPELFVIFIFTLIVHHLRFLFSHNSKL